MFALLLALVSSEKVKVRKYLDPTKPQFPHKFPPHKFPPHKFPPQKFPFDKNTTIRRPIKVKTPEANFPFVCEVCELGIEWLESYLSETLITPQEIQKLLQYCYDVPVISYFCNSVTAEQIDKIIDGIINSLTAKQICSLIELC